MKLIASGVTFSAAIVRSPSFSRSSSSTTMTVFPARMASSASSMLETGDLCLPGAFAISSRLVFMSGHPVDGVPSELRCARDVLADQVAFQVDGRAGTDPTEIRVIHRERDNLHAETLGPEGRHGEAD